MTSNITLPPGNPVRPPDGATPELVPLASNTVELPGDVTARHLSALVLSKRKRVTLTREQLMLWIASDPDPDQIVAQVVALFDRDEG